MGQGGPGGWREKAWDAFFTHPIWPAVWQPLSISGPHLPAMHGNVSFLSSRLLLLAPTNFPTTSLPVSSFSPFFFSPLYQLQPQGWLGPGVRYKQPGTHDPT